MYHQSSLGVGRVGCLMLAVRHIRKAVWPTLRFSRLFFYLRLQNRHHHHHHLFIFLLSFLYFSFFRAYISLVIFIVMIITCQHVWLDFQPASDCVAFEISPRYKRNIQLNFGLKKKNRFTSLSCVLRGV